MATLEEVGISKEQVLALAIHLAIKGDHSLLDNIKNELEELSNNKQYKEDSATLTKIIELCKNRNWWWCIEQGKMIIQIGSNI